MEELKKAQEEFNIALNHFNWAEKDYVDKAISELNVALNNLNEIRSRKGMSLIEL
jgi:hypothetical protein